MSSSGGRVYQRRQLLKWLSASPLLGAPFSSERILKGTNQKLFKAS